MSKYVILGVIVALLVFFYVRGINSRKAAEQNIQAGAAFLAENATQEGVTETPSGLQFKLLHRGDGTARPAASDSVLVHYHGTLIDGTVFDSSVDRGEPISFGLKQVIAGWTEGLQLMHEGDKARLFIPARLGYGNRAIGAIPPGSVLIFDVELISLQ